MNEKDRTAKRILFVCTGNSCRSVMAEGLFKKMTEDRRAEYSVMSAGISAPDGFPATPDTLHVLEGEGVDMSGHASQRLRPEMVLAADKVFVMEKFHKDWVLKLVPQAAGKVHLLTEFAPNDDFGGQEDIPDPIRMSANFYKNVLVVIRRCIERIVQAV